MDKARRHELKMLKYKKRLAKYQLIHEPGKFFAFRSHGAPCSCYMCSPEKYERSNFKKRTSEELAESRCSAYEYLIK